MRHRFHVEIDLLTDHAVDGRLVDTYLAQPIGKLVAVLARDEISRRTLQERQRRAFVGNRGHDCRRRSTRPDHDHTLAFQIEVIRPKLGVNNPALEIAEARPFRRVWRVVVVVALAHPEEVAGEEVRLAIGFADGFHGPEIVAA